MSAENEVQAAETRFFESLLRSSGEGLDAVLGPDFVLIDVLTGSEIPRAVLVELVGSGQLVFESVERLDARVRRYDGTAVVTGQTRMRGHYGEQRFLAHSRYTHVYVRGADGWRLVTAQGTPIAAAA
jgi:hypothetical protein